MALSNDSRLFFSNLSKVWQNFKDYTYLEGINLSQEQINIIEQEEDQLLIEGYAGTGKSLTLIYKFINILIREDNKRVLYVTFNDTLIDDTRKRLESCSEYVENSSKHKVEICTFHEIASKLLKQKRIIEKGVGKLTASKVDDYRGTALRRIAAILSRYTEINGKYYEELPKEERLYKTHDASFITDEIAWIKAMGFREKEKYLETDRIGRSKSIRLTRVQRNTIFKIYEEYCDELKSKYHGYLDLEDYALNLIENEYLLKDLKFDYIFVDEVQDLDPMQIKALCILTKKSITLSGDAKQRIYKKCPIKYEDIGLKVKEKGKRKLLNKNYRSTLEIVKLANSIKFTDNNDKYNEKQFVRSGSKPIINMTFDKKSTIKYISSEIKKIFDNDPYKTIAVIHREEGVSKQAQRDEFKRLLELELMVSISDIKTYANKFRFKEKKQVFYTNPYDIKGLEFDVVFITDFNNKSYPNFKELQKIEAENDGKESTLIKDDILEFINREKKLLYVAMTRAKDNLYLIANGCRNEHNISSFIYDFNKLDYINKNFTKKNVEKNFVTYNIEMKRRYGITYNNLEDEKVDNNKLNKSTDIDLVEDNEILNERVLDIFTEKKKKEKMVQPKTIINNNKSLDEEELRQLLLSKGAEIIDNRGKQGALWVVAGSEVKDIMRELCQKGYKFIFKKEGGRASKYKPAWYLSKNTK